MRLREILRKTGAEKVNIIAHSKGGLDSRWAISKLGLAPHVASLTTINTPHRGCVFAQHLLRVLPQGFVQWVARRYNRLFHALATPRPIFSAACATSRAKAASPSTGRCRTRRAFCTRA